MAHRHKSERQKPETTQARKAQTRKTQARKALTRKTQARRGNDLEWDRSKTK